MLASIYGKVHYCLVLKETNANKSNHLKLKEGQRMQERGVGATDPKSILYVFFKLCPPGPRGRQYA